MRAMSALPNTGGAVAGTGFRSRGLSGHCEETQGTTLQTRHAAGLPAIDRCRTAARRSPRARERRQQQCCTSASLRSVPRPHGSAHHRAPANRRGPMRAAPRRPHAPPVARLRRRAACRAAWKRGTVAIAAMQGLLLPRPLPSPRTAAWFHPASCCPAPYSGFCSGPDSAPKAGGVFSHGKPFNAISCPTP